MYHLLKTTFILVLFFCCLLVNVEPLKAQVTLGHSQSREINTLISYDFIIPAGVGILHMELKGGDGGHVLRPASACEDLRGGEGMTINLSFQVGASTGMLKPGGRLRTFAGGVGGDDSVTECLPLLLNAGGGGGATAVLYAPPGQTINEDTRWEILAIAGGGGGAFSGDLIAEEGFGAWTADVGGFARSLYGIEKGGQFMGFPVTGGQCPSVITISGAGKAYPGGSVACSGDRDVDQVGKNMVNVDASSATDYIAATTEAEICRNGFSLIREVSVKLRNKTDAGSTGGTDEGRDGHGGHGFTGGGLGLDGGGGGGGSSGGAAAVTAGGGGGGSWITCKYSVSNILFAGRVINTPSALPRGTGNRESGYIKFTTNITPFANVFCNDLTVSLGNSNSVYVPFSALAAGSNSPTGNTLTYVDGNTGLDGLYFDCSQLGPQPVSFLVSEANTNYSKPCQVTVTVQDDQAPTALCKNTTVQLNASGSADLTPKLLDNGSSDGCGALSLSISQQNFGCTDIGTKSLTLTVKDPSGNTSTCNAFVTIVDNIAPTAVCQDAVVELDGNGVGTLTAAEIASTSTDACGPLSFAFGDGSTEIALDCQVTGGGATTIVTVTDAAGNQNSCSAVFSVVDNIAPVARCKDTTVELNENGIAFYSLAVLDDGSSDNCSFSFPSPQFSASCNDIGTFATTLTVRDLSGNESTCMANLTIADHLAPIISTELSFLDCIDEDQGDLYEIFYNVTDNCDAAPEVITVIELPELATTNVVFEKKNKKKLQFKFNQNEIRVQAPGNGGAEAWWTEIMAQGGVAVQLDQQISLTGMDGNNTINYLFNNEGNLKTVTSPSMTLITTATDVNGNASTADFTAERQCLAANASSYQHEQDDYASQSTLLPKSDGDEQLRLPQTQLNVSAALEVFPNPFSSHTNIRYHLGEAGQVSLNIFDLQGRLIQQLQQTYREEGDYRVQWDGTDAGGYPLPAGMYLIQLKMGKDVLNKKVLLQR